MANIFRGPLYVNRREVPPVLALGADTSHGTPKTLLADAQLPVRNPPPFEPVLKPPLNWLPADTSHSTPKTLTADKQLPFQNLQQPQATYPWQIQDTTQDQPLVLRPVGVAAPFIPPPHQAPSRFWWNPLDTSQGTPKTLTADKQPPFFNLPYTPPDALRPVYDTSQSAWAVQHPVVVLALPIGQAAPQFTPQYAWSYTDTSAQAWGAVHDVTPIPPVVVPTGGSGGAQGGGKRHLPNLDELDTFKRLTRRRKGQTIVEALREMDQPAVEPTTIGEVAKAAEVAAIAPAAEQANPTIKLAERVTSLEIEVATLKAASIPPDTSDDDAEVLSIILGIL